jgi:putative endonuclease
MHWVYAIYNREADKLYIGETVNIKQRVTAHNNHKYSGYTSKFEGEWKLIFKEHVSTRSEALKREKQLKSFRGREFIKQHIPG